MDDWTEEVVSVDDARIRFLKGGVGKPLLVLHGEEGNPGWLRYHRALAERYEVYAPSHPGFGESDRPDWLETMGDMACFYSWLLEELELDHVPVVGFSMGGWLAAEVAVACPHAFEKLVLVGAAGLKPADGEITDIFIRSPQQVIEKSFFDPGQSPEYEHLYGVDVTTQLAESRAQYREMVARLGWKPYMHDPRLPSLLRRVRIPSLIVWGRQDAIIPMECGNMYHDAITGSTLAVLEECGHFPQIEKPGEFVQLALEFLG